MDFEDDVGEDVSESGDAWDDDGEDVLEQGRCLGGRWRGCSGTGGKVGRTMVRMF